MGKSKDLSNEKKIAVQTLLRNTELSQRQIARKCGVSQSSVRRLKKQSNSIGIPEAARKGRCGRKRLVTPRETRVLKKLVQEFNRATHSELNKKFREAGCDVSTRTLRRNLYELGFKCTRPVTKPKFTPAMLREQQEVQGVLFDSQEQETSGTSFDIKEEITIEETVLEDLIIPKLENEEDPLAEGETETSEQTVAPSISKENTAVLHTSDESRNTGKKIGNDIRVEENHFLNIIPKLEIFENPSEDITEVEENCNLPNVGKRPLQETILRNNLNDNIQISPRASNNSYSKRRKISDQDQDFLNTIQVKSGTDYVDYAMHIATRLQNSNQSDRAIAMAKQKIELILCDLETGLFENSFH